MIKVKANINKNNVLSPKFLEIITISCNNDNGLALTAKNIICQKKSNILWTIVDGSNSKLAKIPGVNPVVFNNLEDYVEFTQWQRSQGIRCPILFLQQSFDAQGNPVYKGRPSPTNLQGGLSDKPIPTQPVTKLFDAGRNDPPYNQNSYPAYDPQDQYIGLKTPLDKMFHDNKDAKSPNPMDTNWGGKQYTQDLIDKGAYSQDEVTIKTNN